MPNPEKTNDEKVLLDRYVPCSAGACNNGCPLVGIANKNAAYLGGMPKPGYCDNLRRELYVDGITMTGVDIIASGELSITGQKIFETHEGYNPMCHLIIKKSGEKDFDPMINDFSKQKKLEADLHT
ncbi:MAG: hypothetical protein PHU12_01680 [Candidatus Aenigmarchaeota archaeon]|nr:hypothetical protein [Candidatus Aenigmarchaeota archaeon]